MFENIKFENNGPCKIEVRELDGEEMHIHEEVAEVIYVVKGELYVNGKYSSVKIDARHFAILAPMENHFISANELCIVAKFYFNPKYFEFYKIRHIITVPIHLNTDEVLPYTYELRNLIVRILLLAYKDAAESKVILFKLFKEFYRIFTLTLSQHNCNKNNKMQVTQDKLERYNRILDFILNNYKKPILLSEVAKKEHISETRLSHFWKDITGTSLQNSVNLYRIFKAAELIINNDMNIYKISTICGFSDIKYFYKYFKEQFKITPKEYRNKYLEVLQHSQGEFKNRILSKQEAETYVSQYAIQYYKVNNELPPNSIAEEETLKEKALSDLFETMQKNQSYVIQKVPQSNQRRGIILLFEHKGIYFDCDKYKVNWEYVYNSFEYMVRCGFDITIIIDYAIMEEFLWLNILIKFQEEVNKIWGETLESSFNCTILVKKFYSYCESEDIIHRFKEKTSIFKQIVIMYVL